MSIMSTHKKRKTQMFGGHSQAQVLDAIKGLDKNDFTVFTVYKKTLSKKPLVASDNNLLCKLELQCL